MRDVGNEGANRQPSHNEAAAFEASRSDRDRTLDALRALEAALGAAAHGKEAEWLKPVTSTLLALDEAVVTERDESLRPDSLLSMIGRDYPRRFGSRVRQLRDLHDDIARQVQSLRAQVEQMDTEAIDVGDLRQRIEWLIRAIYHRRVRESDLVYEAINLDLGSAIS